MRSSLCKGAAAQGGYKLLEHSIVSRYLYLYYILLSQAQRYLDVPGELDLPLCVYAGKCSDEGHRITPPFLLGMTSLRPDLVGLTYVGRTLI